MWSLIVVLPLRPKDIGSASSGEESCRNAEGHACYVLAIVYSHSGFILAGPIDRKLTLWRGSLAALAAVNVALWIWIARSASLRTPYAETQLLLSGVYVVVCGFRSLFPPAAEGPVPCLPGGFSVGAVDGTDVGAAGAGVGAGAGTVTGVGAGVPRPRINEPGPR